MLDVSQLKLEEQFYQIRILCKQHLINNNSKNEKIIKNFPRQFYRSCYVEVM